MPSLSSKKNERNILALLMKSPMHMRAISLDLNIFVNKKNKILAGLIKKYVNKYKTPPSKNTLKRFASKLAQNNIKSAEEYAVALNVLNKLPKIKSSDAAFEFEQAENYKIGRSLIDIVEDMQNNFESGNTDYKQIRQDIITKLLKSGSVDASIKRGKIYDYIKERANNYLNAEKGNRGEIIPFGIKPLDDKLGGMRKTFVTLIYSKTGGGKTRTAVNIAYNAAKAGYRVMYFSLEMAFDLIASCFDSRMAWVDNNRIIFGKLDKKDKRKFANALKKQLKEKLDIWIVDVAMSTKSSTILEEIELYRATNGTNPDLIIIDYANIMEPTKFYTGRSEKYDFLFQEYHGIAKYANVAILTATQESRDASKADIDARKKKQEIEQGVHNIGLSNYMAPHCESVIRLKQDKKDALQNRLWAILDKNRYGVVGDEIPLMAIWSKNYVGDRLIDGMKVYKVSKTGAYQEDTE